MERIKFYRHTIIVFIITLGLFSLPFFWFKPGEMDLGGDSSRLYFYDPFAYLTNYAFYSVSPSSFGAENIGFFMVPFVYFLYLLKNVLSSPTLLITAFHGASFAIAFLTIYGIVKELLLTEKKEKNNWYSIAAIIAGLFYIFSPLSIYGWDKVLAIHNQFFLNPLAFFLLLRYFKTTKIIYILLLLLITFIFSPNFSFAAAPPFFAFYPLSILFLLLYRIVILKKKIVWKHLFVFCGVFIFLHAFHIIPQMVSLFAPGSVLNTTVFSDAGKLDRGLGYFLAIAPNIKTSVNILSLPQMMDLTFFHYLFLTFPLIIIIGFIFNNRKTTLLTAGIFLVVLFFASAHVTNLGFALYKELFNIPGFSMFRNFYGQWQYALLFFYTILFGQMLSIVLLRLNNLQRTLVSFFTISLLILSALPFINGSLLNKVLWQSNNINIFMQIDPYYEDAISFIRALPIEAKVLTLPLTDPGYQIVMGKNNGAYQGPSTISYLAGKKDFTGTVEFGVFEKELLAASQAKDYTKLKQLLTKMGVKYIFYNADPKIYEEGFPGFPYEYGKEYLPKNQQEYQLYLKKLGFQEKKKFGNYYYLYERNNNSFLPHIYTSNRNIYGSVPSDFLQDSPLATNEMRDIFLDTKIPLEKYGSIPHEIMVPLVVTTGFDEFLTIRPDSPIPSAFVSKELDAFDYPVVVMREKYNMDKFKSVNDEYVNRVTFYAEKRINELDKWGNSVAILGNVKSIDELDKAWKEPDLFELKRHKEYNNWEISMVRYKRIMEMLIKKIEGPIALSQSSVANRLYLERVLIKDQARLNSMIINNTQSEKDKIYLLKLSQGMFDHLTKNLVVKIPDISSFSFPLDIPVKGSYNLYLDNDIFKNLSAVSINLGKNRYKPEDLDKTNKWTKIESVNLNKGKEQSITFTIDGYTNYEHDAKWLLKNNQQLSVINENTVRYTATDLPSNTFGVFHEINNWEPNAKYIITFDYNSFDRNYFLKVIERSKSQKEKTNDVYIKNLHTTNTWETFNAVVGSGGETGSAFIHIAKTDDQVNELLESYTKDSKGIEIRNFSVVKILDPEIVLQNNSIKKRSSNPEINFKRINSTKYKITVNNATDPYSLVFLNEFNSKWKLFLTSDVNNNNESKIVAKYTNVSELYSDKSPFDLRFFETWNMRPIAQEKHVKVNDFANAWYIEPKDVNNKKEYSMILEMETQKYFYVGLIISLVTLLGIISYSLYLLFHHEK